MTQKSTRKSRPAKILDLSQTHRGKRKIVIGDSHGTWDEVIELQRQFNWSAISDVLIFTGDLIDRGPKINKIFSFVRYIEDVFTVEGNHEDKFKRWLMGNPVRVGSALQMTIDSLMSDIASPPRKLELLQWLEDLPTMIKLTDDIYVVHAGVDPLKPIDQQNRDVCIRIRTADAAGNCPWWKWDRGELAPWILFGHNVQPDPRVGGRAIALDGGCVFGGELRGIEITPDGKLGELKSVPAKKVYYERVRINQDE